MAKYSVLIKGGMALHEGKLERLDIGIKNDKIDSLGNLERESADLVVDASGKYVSPGFIDLTNHSDTHWTLFSQTKQESMLAQGITTILGGNCGSSLAPLVKASDIEGIQKWADVREINTNWRRVAEFFEELSKHPLGVNFATLVGHGTLRRGILGKESRELGEDELKQMNFMLEEAMKEGAFGLSTSLGAAHAKYTSSDDLNILFKTVAKYGGLAKHHLKDEGKNILPAIAQVLSFARETGVRTQISHFKILGRKSWDVLKEALGLIESVIQDGIKMTIDFFPYTRTGSLLYLLLPSWMIEGGKEKIMEALRDPRTRKEALEYLKSLTLHYDKITVASTLKDSTAVGKTIAGLSSSSGLDPEEIIAELLEINQLQVSIFNEVISPEHLEALIKKEYAMVASDGVGYNFDVKTPFDLPHPRSFGSYPHALEIFAREKEIASWPQILHKFSQMPAEILGLKDRGKIEKGYFADVVIFDPVKIGSAPDYAATHHEVQGMDWVFVNGKAAIKNGVLSGETAGKIIRHS